MVVASKFIHRAVGLDKIEEAKIVKNDAWLYCEKCRKIAEPELFAHQNCVDCYNGTAYITLADAKKFFVLNQDEIAKLRCREPHYHWDRTLMPNSTYYFATVRKAALKKHGKPMGEVFRDHRELLLQNVAHQDREMAQWIKKLRNELENRGVKFERSYTRVAREYLQTGKDFYGAVIRVLEIAPDFKERVAREVKKREAFQAMWRERIAKERMEREAYKKAVREAWVRVMREVEEHARIYAEEQKEREAKKRAEQLAKENAHKTYLEHQGRAALEQAARIKQETAERSANEREAKERAKREAEQSHLNARGIDKTNNFELRKKYEENMVPGPTSNQAQHQTNSKPTPNQIEQQANTSTSTKPLKTLMRLPTRVEGFCLASCLAIGFILGLLLHK